MPPLADDLIVGEIRSGVEALNVLSVQIPGYWIHRDRNLEAGEPPKPGEKVLYYAHGGGYVALTVHPDGFTSAVLRGFLEHYSTIARTLSVEYRLICPGADVVHPFPTALLDALAGYRYLVDFGFKEEDIVLCRDLAGGNFALTLTRYVVDNQGKAGKLPRAPGILVLFSSWTDTSESLEANTAESAIWTTGRGWAAPTRWRSKRSSVTSPIRSRAQNTVCTLRLRAHTCWD